MAKFRNRWNIYDLLYTVKVKRWGKMSNLWAFKMKWFMYFVIWIRVCIYFEIYSRHLSRLISKRRHILRASSRCRNVRNVILFERSKELVLPTRYNRIYDSCNRLMYFSPALHIWHVISFYISHNPQYDKSHLKNISKIYFNRIKLPW